MHRDRLFGMLSLPPVRRAACLLSIPLPSLICRAHATGRCLSLVATLTIIVTGGIRGKKKKKTRTKISGKMSPCLPIFLLRLAL